MKTAKEIYPNEERWFSDYQPILEEFGEILIQVDEEDYQGDSMLLYKLENDKYGILIFGWGSCSGCDALQGCNNYEEVDDLISDLKSKIVEFNNKEDIVKYINNENRKLEYSWYEKTYQEFYEKVKEYLKEEK